MAFEVNQVIANLHLMTNGNIFASLNTLFFIDVTSIRYCILYSNYNTKVSMSSFALMKKPLSGTCQRLSVTSRRQK